MICRLETITFNRKVSNPDGALSSFPLRRWFSGRARKRMRKEGVKEEGERDVENGSVAIMQFARACYQSSTKHPHHMQKCKRTHSVKTLHRHNSNLLPSVPRLPRPQHRPRRLRHRSSPRIPRHLHRPMHSCRSGLGSSTMRDERLLVGPSPRVEAMLETPGAGFMGTEGGVTGSGGGVEGLLAGEVGDVGDDFAPGGLAGWVGPVCLPLAWVAAGGGARFTARSSAFPASRSFFFLFHCFDFFHYALHLPLNLLFLRLHLLLELFALLLALLL